MRLREVLVRIGVVAGFGLAWVAGGWLWSGPSTVPFVACVYVGFLGGGLAGLIGHLLGAGVWSSQIGGMIRVLLVICGLFVLHETSPIPINLVLFTVSCFLCLLLVDTALAIRPFSRPDNLDSGKPTAVK